MNNGMGIQRAAVLTSWKDIARYMGKGVRTVQRWEQDFGLPVRRPLRSNKKAVLARPHDLDAWVAMGCGSRQSVPLGIELGDGDASAAASAGRRQHLTRLTALSAQIETSRLLRQSNKVLVDEVQMALTQLRNQLITLSLGQNPN